MGSRHFRSLQCILLALTLCSPVHSDVILSADTVYTVLKELHLLAAQIHDSNNLPARISAIFARGIEATALAGLLSSHDRLPARFVQYSVSLFRDDQNHTTFALGVRLQPMGNGLQALGARELDNGGEALRLLLSPVVPIPCYTACPGGPRARRSRSPATRTPRHRDQASDRIDPRDERGR